MMWKAAMDSLTVLRALVTVLSICAVVGLVLTALFGFEEPNDTLLLLSSGLLLTAVAAVFVHLGFTRSLNRSQKRMWLHHLTGRRAVRAWAEYLSCDDLRDAAIRFGEEPSVRQ
jgi:O-antigen/teichoic acid export membrane protein